MVLPGRWPVPPHARRVHGRHLRLAIGNRLDLILNKGGDFFNNLVPGFGVDPPDHLAQHPLEDVFLPGRDVPRIVPREHVRLDHHRHLLIRQQVEFRGVDDLDRLEFVLRRRPVVEHGCRHLDRRILGRLHATSPCRPGCSTPPPDRTISRSPTPPASRPGPDRGQRTRANPASASIRDSRFSRRVSMNSRGDIGGTTY
jgi:hypothetical protein